MLGAGVPVALGAVSSDSGAIEKPSSGRRLLTFTDARQGTARLSAKLQADAERAFLRAFVYHAVQSKPLRGSTEEIAAKRHEIGALEAAASPALAGILAKARADLANLEGSADAKPVSWPDMRDRLAQTIRCCTSRPFGSSGKTPFRTRATSPIFCCCESFSGAPSGETRPRRWGSRA